MKKGNCFIFMKIGSLAFFLFIFLCSFFILPSSSELSLAERDRHSASSDTGQEKKFFPAGQRGVKKAKRSLSGKLDEESPHYRMPSKGYYQEGEILLKFKPGVLTLTRKRLLLNYGMTVKKRFRYTGIQVIELPPSMSVGKAIGILIKEPSIEYVEPNFIVWICNMPDDPRFNELWGLHNTGQTGGIPDADIDAPEVWNIHTGSGDVVVGVIDTGVDYTHEDLVGNMWINQAEATGTPGVDDDNNGYVDDIYGINAITGSGEPMDNHGHGTHVSGSIGAVGNNAVGVVGVNWDVEIMGLKFLSSTGSGSTGNAIECIEYVLDMHNRGVNIKVTNNSWGGGGYSQALYDAISALRDIDALFIAAAGNDSADNDASPHYPSSYDLDNIIAVAATDHNDELAWFSNYGATSVDVAAPGVGILSILHGGGYTPAPGDIFFDHVEAGTGNWTSDAPWAITETISYSPTHSWTDSPDEDYENDVNASLTSGIIDLSGNIGQDIRVGFYAWVDLETYYDYLYIEVSGDGGTTWTTVGTLNGHQNYWALLSYYIPEGVRTNQFRFRFRLDTDGSITYDGVYIDDIGIGIGISTGSNNYGSKGGTSMATPHVAGLAVLIYSYRVGINYEDVRDVVYATVDPIPGLQGLMLTGGRINAHSALLQDPADLPPMVSSLSPSQGPVGAEVTINGSRFGDIQGEVTFHEGIQADNIISWSNTSIVVIVPTGATAGPVTVTTDDGLTSAGIYFRVGDFMNLHAFIPTGVNRAAVARVGGKIYVIGGYTQGGWSETGIVQIYDPNLNYWTNGSPKPTPAANAYAAVIDGLIYVAGGYQIGGIYLDTLEIYDPAIDEWTTGTPLPVALSGPGAVALDGKLYVMGGGNSGGGSSDLYEYEPSSGVWTQLASMNSVRKYFATGVIDGKIYAFGGHDGSDFLSSTEFYDPDTHIWIPLASMEIPRYDLAGAVLGGRLYAFGGNSQSFWDPPYVQDIEVYVPPPTDTWEIDSHFLNMARQGPRSATLEPQIFVMGGYRGLDSEEINESLGPVVVPFDPVVISNLSASPTSGVTPLEVSFAVTASGGSGSCTYSWSFGDGESSTLQNPTHTYDTVDTYDVVVTATDADDPDNSTTGELTITAVEGPIFISSLGAFPTSGVVPLDVSFSVTASGGSGSCTYSWSFGDGETSDLQNPTHTYNTAGTSYDVVVTATDADDPDNSTTGELTIIVTEGPVDPVIISSLSATPTSGVAPLEVSFAVTASGGSGSCTYSWSFGDGESSTLQNPTHTYDTVDTYDVVVTATDADDPDNSTTGELTIIVTEGPVFISILIAFPSSGIVPLDVSFSIMASGGSGSYTYSWSFGDGESSTLQNPTHTYDTVDTYDVVVTATDADDPDNSTTGELTIIVTEGPVDPVIISSLSATPTSGVAPLEVSFAVTASGGSGSYTYSWSFGDGESSTLQNPPHTYDTAGSYDVTVTVTDAGDPDNSTTGQLTIMPLDQPVTLNVGISASPSTGEAPLTVTFTASISGDSPPYDLEWDFGDGTTEIQSTDSDTAQLSHTYNTAGTYQMWVKVTSGAAGGAATQTVQASIGISVRPPPEPEPPDKGCFIATAAYGHASHPHLNILRDFRNTYLMSNKLGRSLVDLYYKYSPFVANLITKHKTLKVAVRISLLPMITFSYLMIHFGLIITTVMLSFIFMLPVFLILFFRRRLRQVEAKKPKTWLPRFLKKDS